MTKPRTKTSARVEPKKQTRTRKTTSKPSVKGTVKTKRPGRKPATKSEVTPAVTVAIARLEALCASKETLHLVWRREDLPADAEAPPSFRAFVSEYGYFHVTNGVAPNVGHECIGLFEPERLDLAALDNAWDEAGEEAIAFQRESDTGVDNFYCFNPKVDLGGGEWPVVAAYHDEPLVLATKATKHDRRFDQHLTARIDEFIDTYRDEL